MCRARTCVYLWVWVLMSAYMCTCVGVFARACLCVWVRVLVYWCWVVFACIFVGVCAGVMICGDIIAKESELMICRHIDMSTY